MSTAPVTVGQLAVLASFLATRREALVAAWKDAVRSDPELKIASSISVLHFRDLIPDILENFERRLWTFLENPSAKQEIENQIFDHGLHRWQQGYSLRELVREWGHLQLCVLNELERYGLDHPELAPEVMASARQAWVELCGKGVADSVEQYHRLQEAEAAGRLRDLEQAIERIKQHERQKAQSWHEAAHDLRGNVSVVTTTASLLTEDGVPDALRSKAREILQSSVSSLLQLLEDLMSLARLEAGREQRNLETFDAAVLLRRLSEALEPLAHERGLFLKTEGPAALPVEGDPAKVARIVQNLALNALKYTTEGGLILSWGETQESDIERWRIRVQDTGPGLHAAPGSPVAAEIERATDRGRTVERKATSPSQVQPVADPPGPSIPLDFSQQPGEGIGLSIVKRLCELLEASLEAASSGEGTVFQVSLPRRYASRDRED